VPYETVILENAAIGSTVYDKILITDIDTVGDNLDVVCAATEDDACGTFALRVLATHQDQLRAALVLQKQLDYNENTIFNYPLFATDGVFNATASIEIRVEDIQNSAPVFVSPLATFVDEDTPIGSHILTVLARDPDKGNPRRIVYDLLSNPMDFYLIDSISGELRTAKPLDKEELPDKSGIITLIVRAREVVDGVPSNEPSASTSTKISITIRDVNDVPPTFNQKEFYVTIPENTAIGTPLPLKISVTDPDVGRNSLFSLRLDDVSEVFDVEPKEAMGTTQVSIRVANGSLDYENVNQRKFIVLIIAEETESSSNPRLSSTATLTVSLVSLVVVVGHCFNF